MLIWTYMNKLLLLEFQSFPFTIHDSFQLFEMPQFDFEFFHLGFNQQSNKGFDFPFLNCSQVFGFYSRRGESWNKKSKVRFFVQWSKMQLIPLKNFNIKTYFI